MDVPEGYFHKATSESFNGAERVVIYYNNVADDYLIHVDREGADLIDRLYVTKAQLELIITAGSDVLDDERVR